MDAIASGLSTPVKYAQGAATSIAKAVEAVKGSLATEADSEAHQVSSSWASLFGVALSLD